MNDLATSFAVLRPLGHLLASFPLAVQSDAALRSLLAIGVPLKSMRQWSSRAMAERLDEALAQAPPLPETRHEREIADAHRQLAARGYHWLAVRAKDGASARMFAERLRPCGATSASYYGSTAVEALILHAHDLPRLGRGGAADPGAF